MEYCITTDFDLIETVKILSPFLLSFIIYKVWHWQKTKEVIANKAKNILKIIDILGASYTTLYIQHNLYLNTNKYFDEEQFQKSKNEKNKTQKEFTADINFLLASLEMKKYIKYIKILN